MNERMRILKLLEEGKINAEEAEKLLEAISEPAHDRRRGFWGRHFEFVSEIIPGIFEASFKNHTTVEQREYTEKNRIKIKGISGNIDLTGSDGSAVTVEKDGLAKIYEEGNELVIKALSGYLKVIAPKGIEIKLKGIAGNINLDNLCGKIEVSSVSGDITGTRLSGSFDGEFISGNAELEYDSVENISIRSRNGNLILRISDNVKAEIEVTGTHGNIDCDLPLKNVTRRHNYLKGIFNSPESRIAVSSKHGDIVLSRKISTQR